MDDSQEYLLILNTSLPRLFIYFFLLFLASLGVICFAALSGLDLRVLATVNLFILEKKMINVGQSSGVRSLLLTSIPVRMVSHQPVNSDEESGLMSQ